MQRSAKESSFASQPVAAEEDSSLMHASGLKLYSLSGMKRDAPCCHSQRLKNRENSCLPPRAQQWISGAVNGPEGCTFGLQCPGIA